jgi:hypothetical protein
MARIASHGNGELLCPSAQPDQPEAAVFAVVGGTVDEPRAGYLEALQPVTADLLALASSHGVTPTEIFRFAAPCASSGCQHFDGSACSLATRTVQMLDEVAAGLAPCRIRKRCRWFSEQGPAACRRCPAIVTTTHEASPAMRAAASPPESMRPRPAGGLSETDLPHIT